MSRARIARDGTEEWVRRLVTSLDRGPAASVERMAYGHGSVIYRVLAGTAEVIVRTSEDPSAYAGTLTNLDTLRTLGLPVPTVLAADLTRDRFPFAYIVTDVFPGRDLGFELAGLTRAECTRLAEQIVGFERAAGTLATGAGYGFRPIGAPGGHARWSDAVRADRADLASGRDLASSGDAELAALIRDVWALVDTVADRLDEVSPTCFLDDLTTKNVIVHRGALQGVVDFDVVCYGDPLYWLALTQVAVLSDVGSPGRFYVDALIRLWDPTPDETANLAVYSALHAAEFLTWGGRGDRRARLLDSARLWLRLGLGPA